MILKTLLALRNGNGTRKKTGLRLKEHRSIEFSEKQGAYLFDGETGRSWTLNPSGALILKGLLDGAAAKMIVENLRTRFQVSAAKAFSDVTEFHETLLREGHLAGHE